MAHSLPFRRLSVLLFGVLALTAAGCGGKREVTTVSGKVTVAGKNPLPGGNITFYLISDPNQAGGSVINSDGTFEVVNAPVGECKVVVDNTNLDTSKPVMMMGGGMAKANANMGAPGMASKAAPPGQSASSKEKMKQASAKAAELAPEMSAAKDTGTKKYVPIDPAFTKVETTTLRYTVNKGGDSNVTFDVK